MDEILTDIISFFPVAGTVKTIEPFGRGHINDTFRVTTLEDRCPDYILQRKNHLVFRNVPGMMENIVCVTEHIRKKLIASGEKDPDRKVMVYLPSRNNDYYVCDKNGNYWTMFIYVRDSHGIEEVTHPEQALRAGKAFGHFQLQLADLPGSQLIETIPNFHNGKFRFDQFKTAIAEDRAGRVASTQQVIEKISDRSPGMTRLQEWLDNGELPLRITHNDTKINNVLFDENDNILCIIDLDTVMPGSSLFDFGDAIRTLGNTAPEDEPNSGRIGFNHEYYKAFAKGYLSESEGFLTGKEKDNLAFSCRYMAWEQAMRFLTDYLDGDTYYKIAYPEHNRIRALAQVRYLEVLEENSDFMNLAVV